MKKNNYFQPQTCVERTLPQMVILIGSHDTETMPDTTGKVPDGPGLGAPRRL